MDAAKPFKNNLTLESSSEARVWLLPALLFFAAAFAGGAAWWLLADWRQTALNQYYLLPYVVLAAAVITAPSAYLIYRKKFDPFNPLVFAAWGYFFPAFALGGLLLTFGVSQPVFLFLVQNPETDLPLTFIYITLGYAGLTAGFAIPWARRAGEWMARRWIPAWDWKPADVILPSVLLMATGTFFYFSAFVGGSVGYNQLDLSDSLSSANFFFSLITLEASLMLWLFIFKTRNLNVFHFIALGFLMLVGLSRIVLGGNKGALLLIVMLIAMAFVYSGRRLKFKQAIVFAGIGVAAILIGVIYGTTFRQLKGSEAKTSLIEYVSHAEQTVVIVIMQDPAKTIGDGLMNLAERIETGSSLAVVVSNYENLAPYEAAYGLDNNIWKYTWTAFIPRFIWNDKPVISDARGYSELYFNYGENSFAMTPMGDLLRNFGGWGVPLGMLALGFVMRVIYAALIENQTITIGRAAAYYMMLSAVNWEGFYGTIMPTLMRVGAVALVSLIFVNFLAKRHN